MCEKIRDTPLNGRANAALLSKRLKVKETEDRRLLNIERHLNVSANAFFTSVNHKSTMMSDNHSICSLSDGLISLCHVSHCHLCGSVRIHLPK